MPQTLFSQFFEDKAVEKLLGDEIKSEYLNDDKIGRFLDEIYQIGLNSLLWGSKTKMVNCRK
ncbi:MULTISPECIES: DUF4277 domain-containing protein [Microcystis]|uniref:DUF4277 domain-containing protein n=1 Tax=Microcystis flos-aquae FACHB-1344 TaxID=2692899 RepID=A0ABR8HVR6_9CHRO|nr:MULTISPECIES: DUF4277 domain-containing protein [Microcystis]MBD2623609.1 DUF4277 domain-containing protein [Microcystis flos-aquae FACHB-1344]MCA2700542.1 DUF4277 domain-containing protein [Microcystis sp. M179S2]MCZ8248461.1 DUF4277 domain-containing protein [Microcystis sp. LE19-195.1E]